MIDQLLQSFPLVSEQVDIHELRVILLELEKVLSRQVPGAITEFGCYEGTTSLFMSRLLKQEQGREFHVYDSFEGLPPKTKQDASTVGDAFKAGELSASKQAFIRHFKQSGLQLPIIHKRWFSELTAPEIPNPIAFAFLDGDFYESIRDSLKLIEHSLSPGAIIVVDDYQSEALPGAAKAVDEWLATKPYQIRAQASLAIIQT